MFSAIKLITKLLAKYIQTVNYTKLFIKYIHTVNYTYPRLRICSVLYIIMILSYRRSHAIIFYRPCLSKLTETCMIIENK